LSLFAGLFSIYSQYVSGVLCSPIGRYFASCKEVSSYLLALTSPEESKQQSFIQCTEDSMVEDKVGSAIVSLCG